MKNAAELINAYISRNEIKKVWLAKQLKTKPQYLHKKLNGMGLNSTDIHKISRVLNHNFFEDMAIQLSKEMKGLIPVVGVAVGWGVGAKMPVHGAL